MKVILILARGFHVAYAGCYGSSWNMTPTLDRVASEGVVFDFHYASSLDPEFASQAWQILQLSHFPNSQSHLHEWNALQFLAEKKIPAILCSDADIAADQESWTEVLCPGNKIRGRARRWRRVVSQVRAAVDQLAKSKDWLLAIDSSFLLPPWDIPEQAHHFDAASENAQDLSGAGGEDREPESKLSEEMAAALAQQEKYATAVSYLDEGIGTVLRALEPWQANDDALLLITGDRGQSLGEFLLRSGDESQLHDEWIHLPLVIRLPGNHEGRRITALTQPVDLACTILSAFGLTAPASEGQDLMRLCRHPIEQVRPYALCFSGQETHAQWVLRTREWMLSMQDAQGDHRISLFQKPEDRWEMNNIVQHHLDVATGLQSVLEAWKTACRSGTSFGYPLPILSR
jgi:arylsulfatase A-like enzyme